MLWFVSIRVESIILSRFADDPHTHTGRVPGGEGSPVPGTGHAAPSQGAEEAASRPQASRSPRPRQNARSAASCLLREDAVRAIYYRA